MNEPRNSQNGWSDIRSVLSDSLKSLETDNTGSLEWLTLCWGLTVGRKIAAVTRVEKRSGRTLIVQVAGRNWFPALKSLETEIVKKFNIHAGRELISRLVFKEGNFAAKPGPALPDSPSQNVATPLQGQSQPESEDKSLNMIKDSNLKEILTSLLRKVAALPVACMVLLLSNCTTMPETYPTGPVDLSDSSAVKRVDERKRKDPAGTYRDPRSYYHYLLALQAEEDNLFEEAARHYREVVRVEPRDPRFQEQLANLLMRSGELEEVIEACKNALEYFPDDPRFNMLLADVLASRGENEKALIHYQRVIQAEPENPRAYLMRGTVFEKLKRFNEAFEMHQKVVELEPDNPLGHFYLGRENIRAGNLEQAESSFQKAVSLRPNLINGRELLAWVLEKQGKDEEAIREYKVLLKLAPRNQEILNRLARLSPDHPLEDPSPVKELSVEELLGSPEPHLKIGIVYYEQAMYLKALDEFQLVMAESPEAEIHVLLARIYEILGRVDLAIVQFEALRKLEPESVNLLLYMARLYSMNNQAQDSVRLLREAVAMEPENDSLYHSLALAQMAVNDYDQAVVSMKMAIHLNANKDSYHFELGALLEREGNYEEAMASMKRAIELNPMHSNAHNFLGYMYALQGKELDKALDHLHKAIAIQPRNGYFLDSLGWIYFKKGDSHRALAELKKAMIYTAPDPVLYSHLGDIYHSLNNYEEAVKAWKTSLFLTRGKEDDFEGEMPDPAELERKIQEAERVLKRGY